MENFTRHGNVSNNKASTASQSIVVFPSALNIFLSITASLGNALIPIALDKVTSVHPPTKLLFQCLAVTDLCVGLILQPIYVVTILGVYTATITINSSITDYVRETQIALSFALCGISVLTSTAISVDRFLALKMGVRYRQVVSLRRVRTAITCFWLIGISVGLLHYFRSVRIACEQLLFLLYFVWPSPCSVTRRSISDYNNIKVKLNMFTKDNPTDKAIL